MSRELAGGGAFKFLFAVINYWITGDYWKHRRSSSSYRLWIDQFSLGFFLSLDGTFQSYR